MCMDKKLELENINESECNGTYSDYSPEEARASMRADYNYVVKSVESTKRH
jgi:hypothetical protein